MKFKSKLLTVLSLTTVGVATPITISSCSCSSSYVINYGDKINCKDDKLKEIKFHSIDEVKNSARTHLQIVELEGGVIPLTWDDAVNDLKNKNNSEKLQQFYWDLVYSAANDKVAFTLVWTVNKDEQKIIFNGTEYSSLSYVFEDNAYSIKTNTGNKLCTSYSFKVKS